ncbi:MAG TPA: DUF1080 domain-containing protein, partial [Chitinophagaceae bacterium]
MKRSLHILVLFIMSICNVNAQTSTGNGWTSLFDGKSLSGWKILAGSAKYDVENNAIVGTTVARSRNTFLVTEKPFSDFVLELEVKLQDTTINSGIQFRSQFDPQKN